MRSGSFEMNSLFVHSDGMAQKTFFLGFSSYKTNVFTFGSFLTLFNFSKPSKHLLAVFL